MASQWISKVVEALGNLTDTIFLGRFESDSFSIFHFPFSILDLSFVIANGWLPPMTNGKSQMGNGK